MYGLAASVVIPGSFSSNILAFFTFYLQEKINILISSRSLALYDKSFIHTFISSGLRILKLRFREMAQCVKACDT